MTVKMYARDSSKAGDKVIPQLLLALRPFFQLRVGEPCCLTEPHDTRDVLRTTSQALLLATTVEDRRKLYSPSYVQSPHALRAVKLMSRESKGRDGNLRDIYG